MLRAIFVYKKLSEMTSKYLWERYEDFDCVMNLPYWKQSCDLEKPEIQVRRFQDCCPLCTTNTEYQPITDVIYWGLCSECTYLDFMTSEGTNPRATIGELSGRPLIFYFTGSDSKEELVEQSSALLTEIKDFWRFV